MGNFLAGVLVGIVFALACIHAYERGIACEPVLEAEQRSAVWPAMRAAAEKGWCVVRASLMAAILRLGDSLDAEDRERATRVRRGRDQILPLQRDSEGRLSVTPHDGGPHQ